MMPDLYEHYETLYAALKSGTDVQIIPITAYQDNTGEAAYALPFIVYRQEVERSPYGTPASGSAKVLRSNWLISSYAVNLDEAITNVTDALSNLIDNEKNITTNDGYTTTNLELVGFMPRFEKEASNFIVDARIQWERSI